MTQLAEIVGGVSEVRGIPLSEEEGLGALTLAGFVREIAERYGPREAAVLHLGDRVIRWSYTDLLDRAMEVAKSLVALGMGKGTRVGILMTNRPEFLAAAFGAALAGCVPTPISTFYTATELDVVLKASGVSCLLLERSVLKKDFAQVLLELEPLAKDAAPGALQSTSYPFLRYAAMIDGEEPLGMIEGWSAFLARGRDIADATVNARADAVAPADPGILLFSSGSTGKAKGILNANRAVCLQIWRWAKWYAIDPAHPPRTWSANGFFWSGNFTMAFGTTLSTGGTLLLQRWFDAAEALEIMEKERCNLPIAWPHQWPQLAAAPNYLDVDLSPMRYVDKRMPIAQHPTIHSEWMEPGQAYGNTETFTLISVFPSGVSPEIAGDSHGIPTAGSTIKIVEPLTGKTVPVGERGEIAVKGPTLMLGYIGIPLDESLDSEGFLRTADGGFVDERGRLHWEGRLNDIIKTGGANVSPLEIDAVIRDHPEVKVSQTVGVPDELLGELVVTCIVPVAGKSPSVEAIKAFAKEKLASYKVPRRVLFVAESDLETTGSAKIKTAELRKLAAERLEAVV
ncbi:class I adenylate-forming enzyme family protein [Novosphingobium sp. 9U]|uniref:class I adenylate-forming enzyme family protein n=1 Tax=Novosphingobium sp. 9U TaxID=2653158 RepID=UPI0012F0CC3E|nr:AMP-binding protein [Novosphingobium sp. 9U]VWX54082.1 AMP-dependent synthetase [Novosphingobium sp. 9U]